MAETCIPGQGVTTDTCLHIISLLLPVSKEVYLQNFERHSREVYSIFEHAFCLMIFQDSDTFLLTCQFGQTFLLYCIMRLLQRL